MIICVLEGLLLQSFGKWIWKRQNWRHISQLLRAFSELRNDPKYIKMGLFLE